MMTSEVTARIRERRVWSKPFITAMTAISAATPMTMPMIAVPVMKEMK